MWLQFTDVSPWSNQESSQVTQLFLEFRTKNYFSIHFSLRLLWYTIACTTPLPTTMCLEKALKNTSCLWENCSRDLPHILRHPWANRAIFSLLTSKISSNHIGDDSPWPDPLSPGCGCPAHSGRGACIHPRLIFIFLLLQAPHKCCVLLAVCKTEWQHCLNPL